MAQFLQYQDGFKSSVNPELQDKFVRFWENVDNKKLSLTRKIMKPFSKPAEFVRGMYRNLQNELRENIDEFGGYNSFKPLIDFTIGGVIYYTALSSVNPLVFAKDAPIAAKAILGLIAGVGEAVPGTAVNVVASSFLKEDKTKENKNNKFEYLKDLGKNIGTLGVAALAYNGIGLMSGVATKTTSPEQVLEHIPSDFVQLSPIAIIGQPVRVGVEKVVSYLRR